MAGAADVVHHFVMAVFVERRADLRGDRVQRLVPGRALPLAAAALADALQRVEDALRIANLIDCRGPLGAEVAATARVFRIALKLLNLHRLAVDVGEQPAGRLAVETGSGDDRVVALAAVGVHLFPVVPLIGRRVLLVRGNGRLDWLIVARSQVQ